MGFLVRRDDMPTKGRYPGARPVDELLQSGLIILDKWPGPTSRDVSASVRMLTGAAKAAHAGTLDPAVSGVLPILLGSACKVMPALQKQDKEYVGVMKLHTDVSDEALGQAIINFTGPITQTPPKRAAVTRRPRTRTVHAFEIRERDGRDVLFATRVEAGTYVRTLCHAIGKQIGGAHMTELRRTRAGPFGESRAATMQDLVIAIAAWREQGDEHVREFVLPVELAVEHLKKIIVREAAVFSVASGSPLYTSGVAKVEEGMVEGELIALVTLRGELIGIGHAAMPGAAMTKRSGVAAKPDRIVIDRMAYR